MTQAVDGVIAPSLRACLVNCSLKANPDESHTQKLLEHVAWILESQGVEVDRIHARSHTIAVGMSTDLSNEGVTDDWPQVHERVLASDILVLGSPIWLGSRSSVAGLVTERLYAHSAETKENGQSIYYGKVAGCVVTGNEDGVKAVARETLYALQHIGYTIPPQADCGWLGEIGPGPSYGDEVDGSDDPAGFASDFTNRTTTTMAWNLMHLASALRHAGGIPAVGNTDDWERVANASQATIRAHVR